MEGRGQEGQLDCVNLIQKIFQNMTRSKKVSDFVWSESGDLGVRKSLGGEAPLGWYSTYLARITSTSSLVYTTSRLLHFPVYHIVGSIPSIFYSAMCVLYSMPGHSILRYR